MENRSSTSLREQLRAATAKRKELFWRGKSRRKDTDRMKAAISRAEQFLHGYPYASDERVREWCLAHHEDVAIIVPGNWPTALSRLVMEALTPKKAGAVIEMKPNRPAA